MTSLIDLLLFSFGQTIRDVKMSVETVEQETSLRLQLPEQKKIKVNVRLSVGEQKK